MLFHTNMALMESMKQFWGFYIIYLWALLISAASSSATFQDDVVTELVEHHLLDLNMEEMAVMSNDVMVMNSKAVYKTTQVMNGEYKTILKQHLNQELFVCCCSGKL